MCVLQIVTYEKETRYKASEDTIVHVLIVAALVSKSTSRNEALKE